jgi:hypothetical protein
MDLQQLQPPQAKYATPLALFHLEQERSCSCYSYAIPTRSICWSTDFIRDFIVFANLLMLVNLIFLLFIYPEQRETIAVNYYC